MKIDQEEARLLKEERKQMEVFEQLNTIKSIEHLEARIRVLNWQKYCSKFLFNLELLKIKILRYEGDLDRFLRFFDSKF